METSQKSEILPEIQGEVECRNSEGTALRGRLMRFTRERAAVSFPIAAPLLKISEKLRSVTLSVSDVCYRADSATVASVVNTGVENVCELVFGNFALEIPPMDVTHLDGFFRTNLRSFFHHYSENVKLPAEIKEAVLNLETFLHELKQWMDQMEVQIRQLNPQGELKLDGEILSRHGRELLGAFGHLHARLEAAARQVPADLQPLVFRFMRKHLQPFFLSSPFGYRTCVKPLGYPGDYETVNMILHDPFQGGSLFGRFMNWLLLSQSPSEAHRNRIDHLVTRLIEETARLDRQGKRIRILTVGCGPAFEIQRFVENSPLSGQADFVLLDFNDETLEHARDRILALGGACGRACTVSVIRKSIVHLLKNSSRVNAGLEGGMRFDLLYCAGLLDYFQDQTCHQLTHAFYEWTTPEGLLITTNVATYGPFQYMLETMLDWYLQYRTHDTMMSFVPGTVDPEDVRITSDATGVNLFLEIRRTH